MAFGPGTSRAQPCRQDRTGRGQVHPAVLPPGSTTSSGSSVAGLQCRRTAEESRWRSPGHRHGPHRQQCGQDLVRQVPDTGTAPTRSRSEMPSAWRRQGHSTSPWCGLALNPVMSRPSTVAHKMLIHAQPFVVFTSSVRVHDVASSAPRGPIRLRVKPARWHVRV